MSLKHSVLKVSSERNLVVCVFCSSLWLTYNVLVSREKLVMFIRHNSLFFC